MTADVTGPIPAVRAIEPRDIAVVHALAMASPGAALWPRESYEQLLQPPMLCLVLEAHERILGFVALRIVLEEAEILNLAVDSLHRRTGYASLLLRAAACEAIARGADTLFLEVRESNTVAIQLYERCGYIRTGSRPGYYRDPDEAAILMTKKLTDFPD